MASLSDEQLLGRLQQALSNLGDGSEMSPDVPLYTLGLSSMSSAQFSGLLEQVCFAVTSGGRAVLIAVVGGGTGFGAGGLVDVVDGAVIVGDAVVVAGAVGAVVVVVFVLFCFFVIFVSLFFVSVASLDCVWYCVRVQLLFAFLFLLLVVMLVVVAWWWLGCKCC